jgi:hypothetical protein
MSGIQIEHKKSDGDVKLFIVFTFVTLFFPQFQVYVGLLFEQLLSFGLCFFSFILLLMNKGNRIRIKAVFITLIYLLILFISVLRSLDILIINDLFELAKPIYFFSFFCLAYSIKWNNQKLLKYFSWLMFFLFIGALIGIGESVNSTINALTMTIYKDSRGVLSYKAVFSFITPYTFATVLLLPIMFYFIKILWPKDKYFLLNLVQLLLFLACFILTQSRTLLIGFVFMLLVFFVLVLCNKWYPYRRKLLAYFLMLFFLIRISIPFIVSFAESNLRYLYGGLNVLFKNMEGLDIERIVYSNPSTRNRYEQILFAVEHQDIIPLVGVGIGKAVLMPETFYAMYYYRVGLIGICIHFGIILYSIYWALYFAKRYSALNLKIVDNYILAAIFLSIAVYFISFFLNYLSSAVNDQTRSGCIFYTLIAIVCYYKNHYKAASFEYWGLHE